MFPVPSFTSLGKGMIPEVVHLSKNVIEKRNLIGKRVQTVSISEEHVGNPNPRRRKWVNSSR